MRTGESSAAELLLATQDFLRDELLPGLTGRTGYLARVAINALGIAMREAEHGESARAGEHARLRALLAREGELPALRHELCARIRRGDLAGEDNALMAHLWATTRARLAIDNPGYASLESAREA